MVGDMREHLCWSWLPVSLAWSQDVAEQDRRYATNGSTQAGNLKKQEYAPGVLPWGSHTVPLADVVKLPLGSICTPRPQSEKSKRSKAHLTKLALEFVMRYFTNWLRFIPSEASLWKYFLAFQERDT